jgi:hypothetical protein
VAQNKWKKTPIYIFSTFGSKINEFEQKKLEKNPKTFSKKSCSHTLEVLGLISTIA